MSLGPLELLLIVVLILILFGAGKLPKVMGDLGSGLRSFRKGISGKEQNEEKTENKQEEVKKLENLKNQKHKDKV
jgi:sec-independent protein translocase protein TatA